MAKLWQKMGVIIKKELGDLPNSLILLAGATRLELATSGVTGRRSNQLNYTPAGYGFKKEHVAYVVGGTGLEPVTLGL
jgi:hypothetical protein